MSDQKDRRMVLNEHEHHRATAIADARQCGEPRQAVLAQALHIGMAIQLLTLPPGRVSEDELQWATHHAYPHVLAALRTLAEQGMFAAGTVPQMAPAPVPTEADDHGAGGTAPGTLSSIHEHDADSTLMFTGLDDDD
jgi:hypothetical protein